MSLSDAEILTQRKCLDMFSGILMADHRDIMHMLYALPRTTEEREEEYRANGDPSRTRMDFTPDDFNMWTIHQKHQQVKPFDRFKTESFLKALVKNPGYDWATILVPPADMTVLQKYGFDQEGLRRVKNRKVRDLTKRIAEEEEPRQSDDAAFASLDVIARVLKRELPLLPLDVEPMKKEFVQRWVNRIAAAGKEPAYQVAESPLKRKLEALETACDTYLLQHPELSIERPLKRARHDDAV